LTEAVGEFGLFPWAAVIDENETTNNKQESADANRSGLRQMSDVMASHLKRFVAAVYDIRANDEGNSLQGR
jgi:hypothetical protein